MTALTTAHASTIILGSVGIVIRGPSGSGKSRLSRGLIERFHQDARFAIWISDDQTSLRPETGKLIASAPAKIAGLAEQRFAGVFPVDHHASCIIDLIVDLVEPEKLERFPDAGSEVLMSETHPISLIFAPAHDVPLAIELIFDHVTKLLDQNR